MTLPLELSLSDYMGLAGLTPAQLSGRAGVQLLHVTALMRGDKRPNCATKQVIADALGINVQDIEWPA